MLCITREGHTIQCNISVGKYVKWTFVEGYGVSCSFSFLYSVRRNTNEEYRLVFNTNVELIIQSNTSEILV